MRWIYGDRYGLEIRQSPSVSVEPTTCGGIKRQFQ
jgi:hypothetical protein